ncbi:MAG: sulfite oxidase [Candidatus Solibacter usitatus]|nr:sulfite oxidase [Candidatus Solibacter usitatus]
MHPHQRPARPAVARRAFLGGSAAFGLTAWLAGAPAPEGEVIPFLDTKPLNPEKPTLPWDQLTSWLTPNEHLFSVGHYGTPEVAADRLEIGGLVDKPRSLSLEEIRQRPKREYAATLECSGNGPAGGLIGNARWAGTPLAPLLKECGWKPEGIEVVFFGVDRGVEKIRGQEYAQQFARSLTVAEAARPDILLAYEMNGQPLTRGHGAPLRLVVPGWYGVAWVKWLSRIEVHDRPFLNRFMGRDYVTIRGEQKGDQVIWRETSVGRMNLKSVAARVVRRADGTLQVSGAAWSDGTPIKTVELKIDDGGWQTVQLTEVRQEPYTWIFWSFDWKDAKAGEHTLTSRATDAKGRVQPAPGDPFIALKKTYWEANQQAPRKIRI